MKELWFDVETTGLDCEKQDIVQLAMIVVIDNEEVATKEIRMKPFCFENVQTSALEVHGITIEEIQKYQDPQSAYQETISFLSQHCDKFDRADKFYPGGYNVRFDLDFLAAFFRKNNDKYFGSWQNWRVMDPLPLLYTMDACKQLSLPNYKLETVAEYFGVELKAHDAVSDVRASREVWKRLKVSILQAA
jgi:DNA polymerase-3 subunit epsilon